MARPYELRDDRWEWINDFLLGREGYVGGTAGDNRRFMGGRCSIDTARGFHGVICRYLCPVAAIKITTPPQNTLASLLS